MSTSDIVNLQFRIAELERKVDHLLRHAEGLPPVPPPSEQLSPAVMAHVADGDLIAAIKAYREETGVDLATAKAKVETAIRP